MLSNYFLWQIYFTFRFTWISIPRFHCKSETITEFNNQSKSTETRSFKPETSSTPHRGQPTNKEKEVSHPTLDTLVIDKSHLSNCLVHLRQKPRRHHGLISSASGLLPTSSNRTGQVRSGHVMNMPSASSGWSWRKAKVAPPCVAPEAGFSESDPTEVNSTCHAPGSINGILSLRNIFSKNWSSEVTTLKCKNRLL
jgi:hypothetical protein